jgi:archaellum component FlaG (FlaF/FlaG flagellin family)
MNKKILAKILLPIATVALLGGVTSSLTLTSCSNKKNVPDPSHYVGNMDGTNWKGYNKPGQIQYKLENGGYTLDLSQSTIDYRATD